MQFFQSILAFLLILMPLFGCTDSPDKPLDAADSVNEPLVEESPETYTFTKAELEQMSISLLEKARFSTEPPACWIHLYAGDDIILPLTPEPIQAEMFAELSQHRQQFKDNIIIIEDNFRILRHLTATQSYIAYLASTFPRDEPFETLDEFWKVPPPPTEQYLSLFEGILENPTNEQLVFIYRIILSLKCSSQGFAEFGTSRCREEGPNHPREPDFITRNKHDLTSRNRGHDKWLIDLEPLKSQTLNDRYHKFAEDSVHTDKQKIRGFFNEYGVNNGLIWLAIQEPDITGMFLSNFRDEAVFQEWVNSLANEN